MGSEPADTELLGRLKPRAREALLLAGPDGLTSRQAAAVLGISPAAFRMRLTSARRALARAMADGQASSSPPPGPASARPADLTARVKEVIP
jgi:RNA polymerase sigma-70 factor (ECF subfamily)